MPITTEGIVSTLARAAEADRPVVVKNGDVKVAGKWSFKGTDHGAVIRSIVYTAETEGLNKQTVKKFMGAIQNDNYDSVQYRRDIKEAAQIIGDRTQRGFYQPKQQQPTVLYGRERANQERYLDARLRAWQPEPTTLEMRAVGDLMGAGSPVMNDRWPNGIPPVDPQFNGVRLSNSIESSTYEPLTESLERLTSAADLNREFDEPSSSLSGGHVAGFDFN